MSCNKIKSIIKIRDDNLPLELVQQKKMESSNLKLKINPRLGFLWGMKNL